MDSSPPDRERLRNFFSYTSDPTASRSSDQGRQSQAPDRSFVPTMRLREQTDLLAYWRDWENDVVLGAVENTEPPDDSPDDESFLGGEFSLSELMKALPSDRLERGACDTRDLPPLAAACALSDSALGGSGARALKISDLLSGGANPRERDPVYGRTPLHWACIYAELDAIRVIAETLKRTTQPASVAPPQMTVDGAADFNQPDVNGLTPLQAVLGLRTPGKREHAEIVEYLISQGADISSLPGRGAELLFAEFLTVDIARKVLASGVAVDVRDAADCTPLFKVVLAGHLPLVKFLLEHGADPRQRIFFGGSMLNHYGLSMEVAALLLEHGAEADLRDDLGMTPLMFACQEKNLPLIRLLLRHGASLRARSVDGMRIVDYAPDAETVRFLETEAGLAPGTRLADD